MRACVVGLIGALASLHSTGLAVAQSDPPGVVRSGVAAMQDWRGDAPGVRRRIVPGDMPAPNSTPSASNSSRTAKRPDAGMPLVPPGFSVTQMATGLDTPRVVRVAPNGDVFVAETGAGRVRVFPASGGASVTGRVFAQELGSPFGIAFYPPGPNPTAIYVASTTSVVRFPYKSGDVAASGPAETVIRGLPGGGHSTRDLAFSPDGKTLFVSVGSSSNIGSGLTAKRSPEEIAAFERTHGLGAAFGSDTDRADVLAFNPDGSGKRAFANGLRNCAGLTMQPATSSLWCVVNERDALGDDVPAEYATRVQEGAFYGWPWFYIGNHEDPRLAGARPDLAGKVTVPDVLIQAHSAPLGIAFYEGGQFPPAYKGDAFVALHGSWNRAKRTGYKVVRLLFKDGKPTGEYEDFLTGFVAGDSGAWGRPVGVAVARDGALLVTDDASGSLWRISYSGARS